MIKTLNYCWFGRNPLPDSVNKCIESWKKFCPDHEIVQWNEDNFDFSDCAFAVKAYAEKKWAFVSDYARAKILYEHGGVFLDTDVELIKPIDDLIDESFMGFENELLVAPGLIMNAAVTGVEFFREVYERYMELEFDVQKKNSLSSPIIYTELLERRGLKRDGTLQRVDGIVIYPIEWFNPRGKDLKTKINITPNTYSIHHYDASWYDADEREYFLLRKSKGEFLGRVVYTLKHPIRGLKRLGSSIKNRFKKQK